jgi:aminomethyltransferase
MSLKRTAFFDQHRQAGAKIIEFAGFEMPLHYQGVIQEHRRVRKAVGVFDVSHMGEVEVRGKSALDFVQVLTTNDASKLREGKVQYSSMCYETGGIVDDLLVYDMGDHFMLVINAANIDKDLAWMQQHLRGDVKLNNVSDETALLAVQGPKSLPTIQKLTNTDLSRIPYYHFVRGSLAGVDAVISRTGYTGELGFELYFRSDADLARRLWSAILDAGKEFEITCAGLGARDTLRLEMGFCLYGNDIDETTNPLEAGLGWITKIDQKDFIGREALRSVREHGVGRRLVGFVLEDRAVARHGFPIQNGEGGIGTVTSGSFSPTLEKAIGLGYVSVEKAKPGEQVNIVIRNKEVPARIVDLPFVNKRT